MTLNIKPITDWRKFGQLDLLAPKSETRGFDSWLTSSLRIQCSFPLATSDVETKFYSHAEYEKIKGDGIIKPK